MLDKGILHFKHKIAEILFGDFLYTYFHNVDYAIRIK